MSGCRHGGRDVYERPAPMEHDLTPAIRGHVVCRDGERVSVTFARRFVRDGREVVREIDHVELDGKRYVQAPGRDWDSEVCE